MSIDRRTAIRGAAAAVAAPAVLRAHDALASSGSVKLFAWGDVVGAVQEKIGPEFENSTGIQIEYSTFGSNDEAENKLKATGGKGFDMLWPSVTNVPSYHQNDALQPVDESRVDTGAVVESMWRDSIKLGAAHRGQRYAIPYDWGTEAITFDHSLFPVDDADVSYGMLWVPDAKGQATFRQKSALMGVGLYLDSIGEVPSDRMLAVYQSEDEARRVWGACTKWIIERKANIGAFWNNATEASAAFTDAGCTVGQTWDTTGLLLARDNPNFRYRMPKEGGITWIDGIAIAAGAENLDQTYELINFLLKPAMAGDFSSRLGYNTVVKGAADNASEEYKKQYNEVYDEQTLANLWWWQADTPFFAPVRQEFVEQITNA
ncbi:MAG: extracellular solute-binding protein [Pseudomonadota bacterium]